MLAACEMTWLLCRVRPMARSRVATRAVARGHGACAVPVGRCGLRCRVAAGGSCLHWTVVLPAAHLWSECAAAEYQPQPRSAARDTHQPPAEPRELQGRSPHTMATPPPTVLYLLHLSIIVHTRRSTRIVAIEMLG